MAARVILNCGYVLVGVRLTHRRLLKGENWRWFLDDVAKPLAVGLAVAFTGRFLLPDGLTRPVLFLCLAALAFVILVCSALAAPDLRQSMVKWVLERGRR
ncbi:MAG: hypothetical protein WBD75_07155 [Phycisphaerae bacterium]